MVSGQEGAGSLWLVVSNGRLLVVSCQQGQAPRGYWSIGAGSLWSARTDSMWLVVSRVTLHVVSGQ